MSTVAPPPRISLGPDTALGSALAEVDAACDAVFVELRGKPGPDTAAAVLSNLADYGFIWAVVAGLKGLRRGRRWHAIRALAVAGVTSYAVNKALKGTFGRPRPDPSPDEAERTAGIPVRPPSSSSFPSGHTLAAFCTAVVLADSPAQLAAFTGFAGAVAASRVHLGAHHATDVIAGAAAGTAVGLVARRLLRR